jgi:hypothetical protein
MKTRTRWFAALSTIALVMIVGGVALAQRDMFGGGPSTAGPNIRYDGRFTFARIRYQTAPGGFWAGGRPSWIHGYPLSERNLMMIMKEVSLLDAHVDEVNTFTFDDPELLKYPIAYLIEVGWWTVSDREAAGLRAYLNKGGFLFIDDFKPTGWRGNPTGGWEPFEETMRRVLPGVQFFDMDPSDPVFHSFFEIKDRSKRLMAIINYNTDVSQFWEWSGRGFRPFDQTNEAYKLGVNYLIYALTH